MPRDTQGKVTWRPEEPARHPLYRKLYLKLREQDEMMAVLYREVFALKDRVRELEFRSKQ